MSGIPGWTEVQDLILEAAEVVFLLGVGAVKERLDNLCCWCRVASLGKELLLKGGRWFGGVDEKAVEAGGRPISGSRRSVDGYVPREGPSAGLSALGMYAV